MRSFYGDNSGITATEASNQIKKEAKKTLEEANNHVIISKTQPTVQKAGDVWFVIISDD